MLLGTGGRRARCPVRGNRPTPLRGRASCDPGEFRPAAPGTPSGAVRRHAEPDVAGTAVGCARRSGGAAVAPAVRIVAEVGAASRNALCWPRGTESVRGPLPDVARRVVEAVTVRREG